MKTPLFLSIFIMVCVCGYAQDRDEIFTRPPVRGSFYKLLSKDEIDGRGNIVAGKVVSASGILGHINVGLPYIESATHEPWIEIGTRILSASDVADIPGSLNWYTAKLISDVTTWVMDQGSISNSSAPITIIYATNIQVDIIDARVFNVDITNATTVNTSILNATNIDVDIIDARVFNVDVTYATTTNTTVLYASAVITLPYEQIFQGDGYTADIVLDHPAHTEGFIVEAITTEHISHVWEWELNSAYTQNLDADGYVTSISLVSGYRWYHNNRFRIRYVRADL